MKEKKEIFNWKWNVENRLDVWKGYDSSVESSSMCFTVLPFIVFHVQFRGNVVSTDVQLVTCWSRLYTTLYHAGNKNTSRRFRLVGPVLLALLFAAPCLFPSDTRFVALIGPLSCKYTPRSSNRSHAYRALEGKKCADTWNESDNEHWNVRFFEKKNDKMKISQRV